MTTDDGDDIQSVKFSRFFFFSSIMERRLLYENDLDLPPYKVGTRHHGQEGKSPAEAAFRICVLVRNSLFLYLCVFCQSRSKKIIIVCLPHILLGRTKIHR